MHSQLAAAFMTGGITLLLIAYAATPVPPPFRPCGDSAANACPPATTTTNISTISAVPTTTTIASTATSISTSTQATAGTPTQVFETIQLQMPTGFPSVLPLTGFTVDGYYAGTSFTTQNNLNFDLVTYAWNLGSSHAICAPSTVQGQSGVASFVSWSDGGSLCHQIIAANGITVTATYQASLTTTISANTVVTRTIANTFTTSGTMTTVVQTQHLAPSPPPTFGSITILSGGRALANLSVTASLDPNINQNTAQGASVQQYFSATPSSASGLTLANGTFRFQITSWSDGILKGYLAGAPNAPTSLVTFPPVYDVYVLIPQGTQVSTSGPTWCSSGIGGFAGSLPGLTVPPNSCLFQYLTITNAGTNPATFDLNPPRYPSQAILSLGQFQLQVNVLLFTYAGIAFLVVGSMVLVFRRMAKVH